ncbi:MAG: hypothetical protein IJJ29_01110 [Solobacterium sp.]|nr:hypothetical protein [Solobacterium sp.]
MAYNDRTRKVWIYLICLLCITAGCTRTETPPAVTASDDAQKTSETVTASLRFDGLYCYISDDSDGQKTNRILRFYEDGVVISTSIQDSETTSYFPTGDWFHRESPRYTDLLGNYTLDGDHIALTTVDKPGTVDYQGTLERDRLVLDYNKPQRENPLF